MSGGKAYAEADFACLFSSGISLPPGINLKKRARIDREKQKT